MSERIVTLNEEVIKGQIKELVRGSVEETLNELLCECQRKSEPSANQYLSHLCERILEPPTPKVTANT